MKKGKTKQTLCWRCQNCVNGCTWARELQPVAGWKATDTIINDGMKVYNSFHIEKCPQFKRKIKNEKQAN